MEPGGSMPHSQGLSNNSYPEQKTTVTKIESDRETLIGGRLKLFRDCCAIEYVRFNIYENSIPLIYLVEFQNSIPRRWE